MSNENRDEKLDGSDCGRGLYERAEFDKPSAIEKVKRTSFESPGGTGTCTRSRTPPSLPQCTPAAQPLSHHLIAHHPSRDLQALIDGPASSIYTYIYVLRLE